MESMVIRTGLKAVPIENELGEIRGIFKFRPTDAQMYKKLKDLMESIKERETSVAEREELCKNDDERMALFEEVCDDYKNKIDMLYGAGSSKILFDDAYCFEMFEDFFQMMNHYYGLERKKATSKYKK